MTAIGHLGKDAEVKIYQTESVINFSIAHTDKYVDNGIKKEKTTWVSCSWWVESSSVAQYMKKGTQVYVEGFPEAKLWKKKEEEQQPFLNLRVFSLQLLGSPRREGEGNTPSNNSPAAPASSGGYVPYQALTDKPVDDPDGLPF